MTMETAVAIADGHTERANARWVELTGRVCGEFGKATVRTNYPVHPGNTIYVKERFF